EVRLDSNVDVEAMAVGRYATIEANGQLFFGMITDVELRTTMPALLDSPPGQDDDFLRDVYRGTAAYAVLHVTPMLRVSALENNSTRAREDRAGTLFIRTRGYAGRGGTDLRRRGPATLRDRHTAGHGR
ncbi:MAG TPA: hypothetical protein VIO16_12040, partial [Dehalococcoidia bacterium]